MLNINCVVEYCTYKVLHLLNYGIVFEQKKFLCYVKYFLIDICDQNLVKFTS